MAKCINRYVHIVCPREDFWVTLRRIASFTSVQKRDRGCLASVIPLGCSDTRNVVINAKSVPVLIVLMLGITVITTNVRVIRSVYNVKLNFKTVITLLVFMSEIFILDVFTTVDLIENN